MGRNSKGDGNFYYSMSYSHVHFIVISSEHPIDPPSRQYKWLEEDLKKVDRSKTPWIILTFHQSPYSTTKSRYPGNRIMRNIETLLLRYGVELVLTGHDHNYEVSCKVFNEQCGRGPVYLITGTAGAGLYRDFYEPKPAWSLYREASHGFVQMDVTARSIKWRFIRDNSTIGHEFEITK